MGLASFIVLLHLVDSFAYSHSYNVVMSHVGSPSCGAHLESTALFEHYVPCINQYIIIYNYLIGSDKDVRYVIGTIRKYRLRDL